MTAETIPALRQSTQPSAPPSDLVLVRGGQFVVTERQAPGPCGAPDVSLLICRPGSIAAIPAVYVIHGGGMVLGDNRSGISEQLDWAGRLSLALVSVDYRLAPETPHPGPVDDCYAGLVWIVENAAELGIDPDRIVVVGASAGGG